MSSLLHVFQGDLDNFQYSRASSTGLLTAVRSFRSHRGTNSRSLDTVSSDDLDTRSRILRAALTLLEASQGRGVRMTDIAKRAGISRQALYLHFDTRAALLIATTHYLDDIKGRDGRLAPSRAAQTGTERLDAFIEAWGGYIPEIYGIAKALLAMRDTDDAAANAWDERMRDMREGCEAAIDALDRGNMLSPDHSPEQATDILWTMLSVRNWEQLTIACGWSHETYIETIKSLARRIFVKDATPTRRSVKLNHGQSKLTYERDPDM